MADILFVAITVLFFAVAALFVTACERILGPDENPPAAVPTPVTSDTTGTTGTTDMTGDRPAVAVR